VSLWAKIERAVDGRLVTPRAASSLRAFRELIATLSDMAGRETLSVAISKILDQSGYITDLREERSEEAQVRIDNLMELVSAAREFETREPEPSLAAFVDRLSLLSDVDQTAGSQDARIWLMTMHAAKGLEFPLVVISGLEEGLFPHSRASDDEAELDEERRLCYVAMTRARSRLVLTGAARRRVFGEYQGSEPSRFLDEIPAELVERLESPTLGNYQRALAYGGGRESSSYGSGSGSRRGRYRSEQEDVPFKYEDEDQSMTPVRVGARVRHPTFGLGTVVSVEPLTDDMKLVVRFEIGATKTLRAKYAKLELA
jgi:DNA helicase-2/ATP-dependent DNA helicase PcrA